MPLDARLRRLALGLLAAGGAAVAYGVYAAGDEAPPPPVNPATAILGGEAVGHRLATRSWSLRYDSVVAGDGATRIEARGLRDGAIYRGGVPVVRASADHVAIDLASKDFSIDGRVHLDAWPGGVRRSFDADAASWSEATGVLAVPGVVRLSGRGATLFVRGIRLNARTGVLHLGRIDGAVAP